MADSNWQIYKQGDIVTIKVKPTDINPDNYIQ